MIYTYQWRYGLGTAWSKDDCQPCPVDDAPCTTCTSPDYRAPLIIPQLPARDALAAAELPPPPTIAVAPTAPSTVPSTARRARRQIK
jgi:hypothetical protein